MMKMMNWKRMARNERGAALVETALSATILLGVLIGMMQGFMALYGYHYVAYAAREASRWAMVRGGDCHIDSTTMPDCGAFQSEIQTYVQNLGFPGINANNVTVTATWDSATTTTPTTWSLCSTGTPGAGCNQPGNMVTVNVTYAFPLNIPFMSSQTINMQSQSSMVITQ